ncbi:MAG: TetR/AcrR family transcriptional regulator [Eubacteriaceae bacterium]|jgi:probable dihydroxyacetone kinase regulator|nr:TetR/AcrR family transcriptional regulator [Eubacteriaceae bacterium]
MDMKRRISDAFIRLLLGNSFENITIQMVLNEAGISRATFYRNFADKYELMNWYYHDYVNHLMIVDDFSHYRNFIYDTFVFVKKNKDYFKKIIDVHDENSFENFIYHYAMEYYEGIYKELFNCDVVRQHDKLQMMLISYGAGRVVCDWVRRDCDMEPAELADVITEMLPPSLKKGVLIDTEKK